jgi:hypothetical protein
MAPEEGDAGSESEAGDVFAELSNNAPTFVTGRAGFERISKPLAAGPRRQIGSADATAFHTDLNLIGLRFGARERLHLELHWRLEHGGAHGRPPRRGRAGSGRRDQCG